MSKKKQNKPGTKRPKGKNAFAESVLHIFTNDPFRVFNYKQVSAKLGVKDTASRDLVNTILVEFLEEGTIEEVRLGKYKLNEAFAAEAPYLKKYITGRVDMKNTGKAYVIMEEGGEDIYIAPNNTSRALHGDTVRVLLFPKRQGHKPEGQIIEILQRGKEQFVGIVEISRYFAFLKPDNMNMPIDIFIPKEELKGAKNGMKVIVKITDWPEQSKNPFGTVVEVLGEPGDNDVEMKSILAEFDFPLSFPGNVEKEAEKTDRGITPSEIKKRKDYREVFTLTIDPADAKDFDDALSLKKLDNGHFEVGVHIADVSFYVKPGSLVDQEAFKRGTSVYLVDRTIPMLPEKLSNDLCSLRPNEEKLCYAAIFELDEEANVQKEWFGRTVIKSNRRFNYDEVQQIIENEGGEYSEEILILHRLATKLRADRFHKGSINFETQEVKFNLDEKGKPVSVYIKEQKESNKLIEDFMLLANKRVAELIGKVKKEQKAKTFVYRIHDQPNPDKLANFSQFLVKLGYKLNIDNRKGLAISFNKLFKQIEGKGEQNMIETIAIRTMAKAVYSCENIGHYGLGFTWYTHFTSPIRRYPDLMVHRLLDRYLDGGGSVNQEEYEKKCEHSSDMERKAVEAERESIKYKQAEYMLEKIGQEFDGLISGVSKWGIYVEIVGNKCEGMVRLKDMLDDYYYLDEENYQVIGHRRGQQYKLGGNVKIRVKRIDLSRKEMDFDLVTDGTSFKAKLPGFGDKRRQQPYRGGKNHRNKK
jgi:ribonuclease R